MKTKFLPFAAVALIPVGAAVFLVSNRTDAQPPTRDESVSITQKHVFSDVAGHKEPAAAAKPVKAPAKAAAAKGLRIGDAAPDFAFTALDGQQYTLSQWRGKLPLVMLADTTCPCVKAYNKRMKALATKFPDLRIVYAFPSPVESREQVQKFAAKYEYAWPVVYDDKQALMGSLGGRCTTESFLFDRDGKLRYHGRIDDNIYDEPNVRVRDLENALTALTEGKTIVKTEVPAYGCVIPELSPANETKVTGKTS